MAEKNPKPNQSLKATWRSGYAAVCKTVYAGSIPAVASTLLHSPTIVRRQRWRGTPLGRAGRLHLLRGGPSCNNFLCHAVSFCCYAVSHVIFIVIPAYI